MISVKERMMVIISSLFRIYVLDEEEENQKKQMKKQDKQQRGSKSAYAIFMSEQHSD